MKISNVILTVLASVVALAMVVEISLARSASQSIDVELTGQRAERTYEALPFKHLDVEGPIRVILTAGLPSHRIEADAALLDLLIDKDDDPDRLHLELEQGDYGDEIVAYISSPNIESIELNGSGSVESPEPLPFRQTVLRFSGNPRANLNFTDAGTLSVDGSGGTNITLAGRTDSLIASFAGGNDLQALNLQANFVSYSASGGNSASVNAERVLDVRGAGSTNIEYTGSPRVSQSISGSGSVKAL